jgi:transcriptional regulator with XRE-family HTH domain
LVSLLSQNGVGVKFEPLVKRLGSQIVALRQKKGLTQAELANRSEISLKYVSMIESGTNSSLKTLLKLCDGLETSLPVLMEQARKMKPMTGKKRRVTPLAVPIPTDCPYFKKIVSMIRKLESEDRGRALDIIRTL